MTPDEIRIVNLRDLTAVYRRDTAADWGARLVDVSPQRLPLTVRVAGRFHRLVGRASPLDAIRELLLFYGLLEIASLAGVIPAELPPEFAHEALRHLRSSEVRALYEGSVPMILPQLFRLRLEREQGLREERVDSARPLFQHLLGLYGAISSDGDIAALLAMARRRDGRQLGNLLVHSLESQAVFLDRVLGLEDTLGDSNRVIEGFRKLVLYCIDMSRIFAAAREFPFLGAAFRSFHVDWLLESESLRSVVAGPALLKLRSWRPAESDMEPDRARAVTEAFDRLENSVLDVFSLPALPRAWQRLVQYRRPAPWD
jgi:hypothetical protein